MPCEFIGFDFMQEVSATWFESYEITDAASGTLQ